MLHSLHEKRLLFEVSTSLYFVFQVVERFRRQQSDGRRPKQRHGVAVNSHPGDSSSSVDGPFVEVQSNHYDDNCPIVLVSQRIDNSSPQSACQSLPIARCAYSAADHTSYCSSAQLLDTSFPSRITCTRSSCYTDHLSPAAECLSSNSDHSYSLTASTNRLSPSNIFITENPRSSSAAVLLPLLADEPPAQLSSNFSGNVPETAQCPHTQTVKQQVVLKNITNWKVKKTLFGEAKVSADGEAILPPEMLNKILKENELLSSSKTFF